jgi:WD40 repeat protein
VVLPVAALAVAGCGGGMQSSSAKSTAYSLSTGCAARGSGVSDSDLLWLRDGRVYFVDKKKVISSQGHGTPVPAFTTPVGFRACGTPLLLYTFGPELRAMTLSGPRKTIALGRNVAVAPDLSLVSFSGSQITAGSSSFVARGLPLHWKISSIAVSPRDPHVFLAAAQSPEAGIETCGKGLGGIYRITPSGSKAIFVDNPCRDHPQAAFSPNGATISYVGGPSASLYTRDASGAHLRRVTTAGDVTRYLWSPDGTMIAFGTKQGAVAVLSLKSGAVHQLGRGAPLAWSPDGREVALAAAGKSLIEAVPASGGGSHVLLRLQKS